VLHRQRDGARRLIDEDLKIANDVPMLDAAERAGFRDDLFEGLVPEPVREEELQRDDANLDAAIFLGREIDRRKTAFAKSGEEAKGSEARTDIEAPRALRNRTEAIVAQESRPSRSYSPSFVTIN
jgi:hypothetical protein